MDIEAPAVQRQLHIRPGETACQLELILLAAIPQVDVLGKGQRGCAGGECAVAILIEDLQLCLPFQHRAGSGQPSVRMPKLRLHARQCPNCSGGR